MGVLCRWRAAESLVVGISMAVFLAPLAAIGVALFKGSPTQRLVVALVMAAGLVVIAATITLLFALSCRLADGAYLFPATLSVAALREIARFAFTVSLLVLLFGAAIGQPAWVVALESGLAASLLCWSIASLRLAFELAPQIYQRLP